MILLVAQDMRHIEQMTNHFEATSITMSQDNESQDINRWGNIIKQEQSVTA